MTKIFPITILRVFCLVQVFLIHYFARIGLRDMNWIFSIAVPSFLLVSAFLYGLKSDEKPIGKEFLIKRFKSIAIVYYPFITSVFLFYVFCDSANSLVYLKSFVGELFFLCDFVTPLPGCGHLWFMQTLAMCYISLAISSHLPFIKQWFQSFKISIVLLALVIACGFVYRGAYLPFIFFYLWTFYNASTIRKNWSKSLSFTLGLVLLLGYLLLSINYENYFHIGIYIKIIQACMMAILMINVFMELFATAKEIRLITVLSAVTMEFYLIHHLFVFDFPIHISLTVTMILSTALYFVAQKMLSLVHIKNKVNQ